MGKAAPGNIILTGFSFTGKSLVGQTVARWLGWRFIDTDERIAKMAGKPIPTIFSQEGETAFRALERRALEEACAGERAVIATGGGAVVDSHNRALMEGSGLVVCLEARPQTIYSRLKRAESEGAAEVRPLLAGPDPLERIRSLKESRQPYYAQAHWTVHTDALAPEEVAGEVVRAWELARGRPRASASQHSGYAGKGVAATVATSTQSYPISVGWGTLTELGQRLAEAGLRGRAFVVADGEVWPRWGDKVARSLSEAGLKADLYLVTPGENSKSLAMAQALYSWLAERRAERGEAVVALGGGMVGDLAGFVAATYLRGLPLVQVPTTLVAMVDASIGGKVAVNLPQAKNLVGAFYQPRLVLSDVETLLTLPPRELASGWSEVIKHGLVIDPRLAEFLESQAEDLLTLKAGATVEAISWSARLKAGVVSRDERETGERILLNYGHTVGHALEAATEYQGYLHGEAVSLGMMAAALISHGLGLAPLSLVERHRSLLSRFGLPISGAKVERAALLRAMELDKKVSGKAQRWVLLAALGQPVVRDDVPSSLVETALDSILGKK